MEKSNIKSFPKKNSEEKKNHIDSLSPREIVSELDRYVVGQNKAKRAVAIALRNRWRRQALKGEMRDEVLPKNILMIGPTGVGKTEISRRLSKLAEAPFVKVREWHGNERDWVTQHNFGFERIRMGRDAPDSELVVWVEARKFNARRR